MIKPYETAHIYEIPSKHLVAGYNSVMQRFRKAGVLGRILIPFFLIAISGISARSHQAAEALRQANISVEADNPGEAHEWFVSAAEMLPRRAGLWENAGQQAMLADNPDLAIEYFSKAADQGNLSMQAQIELGNAYQQVGELSLAIQVWESILINEDVESTVYWMLARAQRQMGDYAAAIQYLREFVQLEPGNAAAQYELGILLAIREPRSAPAHLALAEELDLQYVERVAVMQSALRSAQFDNPPAYVFTLIGQALGALDEWELARAAFLMATELDPSYSEAWAFLGEAYNQTGENRLIELEVGWALDPDSLAANILLSLYWQRLNDMEQAMFYLENAAKIEPANPALQADLGALYLSAGDLEAALEHYQNAAKLSPHEPRYWVLLATFSVEHEIYVEEAGLPAAQQAYELSPNDAAVATLLGRTYFLLGDYVISADFYSHAIRIDPDYPPAHLYLGLLYVTIGDLEFGQFEFMKVIEIDPDGQFGVFAKQLMAQYYP